MLPGESREVNLALHKKNPNAQTIYVTLGHLVWKREVKG
jgi:hypothetical protein